MYLKFNEEHVCTDSYQSPEPYGDWWAEYYFQEPTRAWEVSKGIYGSYPYVGPEPTKGDTLYVIYAVWSSGDSFGSDSQGSYEFLCVNHDRDKAYANLEKLRRHSPGPYDYTTGGNQVEVDLDDGSTMTVYTGSWRGYFESLDTMDIAAVTFDA